MGQETGPKSAAEDPRQPAPCQLDKRVGPAEIERAGQRCLLLPEKALFLPHSRTLLVADVHLGKAATFRRLGVPVPQGTTTENLAILSRLIHVWAVERIVFLGDLLHGPHAHAQPTLQAVRAWIEQHAGVRLILIRGNHDLRSGDPPGEWDIAVVDEPWSCDGLSLYHHPPEDESLMDEGAYAFAGHAHPCVQVVGAGRDRLRLPCFHLGARVGVLPAFGRFTGMHPIVRRPGQEVYAIADAHVMGLP